MTPRPLPACRGGAALAAALMLAFAMGALALFTHHNVHTAQQLAATQYRATRAFEAADAGLGWMLARLNAGDPVDSACVPRPDAPADELSFRARHVGEPAASGAWLPPAVQPACRLTEATAPAEGTEAASWSCHCPAHGDGAPARPEGTSLTPAFAVRLQPHATARVMTLQSTGCSDTAPPCVPAAEGLVSAEAHTRLSVDLAHLPALAQTPIAALTVHGDVQLGASPWRLVHPGTDGSLALHAGGAVQADRLTMVGAPGSPAAAGLLANDAALARVAADARFPALFRLDKPAWRALPSVRRVACSSPCDAALAAALGPGTRHPMVWLDGGLQLAAPATLGTAARPVLLVADGPVRLTAPLVLHGLLYTTSPDWHDPAGAQVNGAVVAEGALHGSGATRIRHDAAVLAVLHQRTGTFVRVNASWKDF